MLSLSPELRSVFRSRTFQEMKVSIIEGEQAYSFGGHELLTNHIAMLRCEFCGRTELEFYHAVLIVMIRRKIDLQNNVGQFFELWQQQSSFLADRLDSRWLVSACDTIMDHAPELEERALALAGTLFTNTIKLYETEYWALGLSEERSRYIRMPNDRVALHDGMSGFMIGSGDMIANMYQRASDICTDGSAASQIVRELLARARNHDTVFGRFRRIHSNENSAW